MLDGVGIVAFRVGDCCTARRCRGEKYGRLTSELQVFGSGSVLSSTTAGGVSSAGHGGNNGERKWGGVVCGTGRVDQTRWRPVGLFRVVSKEVAEALEISKICDTSVKVTHTGTEVVGQE